MARSITDIQTQIINNLATQGIVVSNNQFSRRRLWTYIIAYCAWLEETLFDTFTIETLTTLKTLKPPSRQWYANKVLNYQYGFPLIPETDQFDNTGYTDDQIAASKVIKFVAVIKQTNAYGRIKLRIKTAAFNGTDLIQTPAPVLAGLQAYGDTPNGDGFVAPGDNVEFEGKPSDKLKMKWRIYYDPLVMSSNGSRLDGTASQPVRDAIISFLKDGIPFSGTYVIVYHIDWVQKVPGVVIPEVVNCSASYGLLPLAAVSTKYDPDGGWLRFEQDSDLEIEYIAQQAIQ